MLRAKLVELADWRPETILIAIEQTLAELAIGMGKLGPIVRLAITGSTTSPALEHTIYLCGKPEALTRIDAMLARGAP